METCQFPETPVYGRKIVCMWWRSEKVVFRKSFICISRSHEVSQRVTWYNAICVDGGRDWDSLVRDETISAVLDLKGQRTGSRPPQAEMRDRCFQKPRRSRWKNSHERRVVTVIAVVSMEISPPVLRTSTAMLFLERLNARGENTFFLFFSFITFTIVFCRPFENIAKIRNVILLY